MDTAEYITKAVGGYENIEYLEHCNTRLRFKLKNIDKCDTAKIRSELNYHSLFFGNYLHIIVGPIDVDILYDILIGTGEVKEIPQNKPMFKQLDIISPVNGILINHQTLSDETFANSQLGPTFAFTVFESDIYSPIDGKVLGVFPTKHSYNLQDTSGVIHVIHIGIDTFKLGGEGFEAYVKAGDNIKSGEKIASFNKQVLRNNGILPNVIYIINIHNIEYKILRTKNKILKKQDYIATIKGD